MTTPILSAVPVPVPAAKRPPMWVVAHRWQPEHRDGTKVIDWAVDNFQSKAEAVADAQTNGGIVFYLPGSDEVQS